MPQVNVEHLVDHLRREFERAIASAVHDELPEVVFEARELFAAFRRSIERECDGWARVPDRCVRD